MSSAEPSDAVPSRRDAEGTRRRWDERYAETDGSLWGRPPNATVAELAADLPAGDVLDLGAGDGRNAVWLAGRGHRVTAVDISPVGLAQTRERAEQAGVDVETVEADLAAWTPPASSADLVVLSFTHIPQPDRGRMHRAAAAALRPGGLLVLVAHDRSNLDHGVGGPPDPAVLPTADEVRGELASLSVDRAEVIERLVDGHDRPALDLVVVARRPEA